MKIFFENSYNATFLFPNQKVFANPRHLPPVS